VKGNRLIPWLVVAAGLLAYHNSFTGPFIFDDAASIQDNLTIRHLWPIWGMLSPHTGAITVEGRPLINLSLAVNYAIGGYAVRGYHVFNLAVHILAGLTLFGIVRRTLRQPRSRERFGDAAEGLAVAAAVLWTVHPLQTESVTYVIQRAESIMGLCYLLTLYCFIRGAESSRPRAWYGPCVGACVLGMASKEVMVSAPLMVLLYDRAFVAGTLREAWRRRWKLYLALAGSWIVLGYLMFFTGSVRDALANAQVKGIGWWAYWVTEPGVILHYLRLCVWPQPLCLDYGWPIATTWASILPPALVVLFLLGMSVWGLKKNSAWGFLGAWFFLILAPTSSFFPTDSPRYEHRMYLSLAAVIIFGVIGIRALARRQSMVIFAVVAIGFGSLTVLRNEDYRSAVAFWDDAVAKRPENYGAHNNFGIALQDAGRIEEAIHQLEEAVRLQPGSEVLHYNLGNALFHGGRFEEAIDQYDDALQLKPEFAEAHYSMGVTLARTRRTAEAVRHYEEALRINPDYAEARRALAQLRTNQ